MGNYGGNYGTHTLPTRPDSPKYRHRVDPFSPDRASIPGMDDGQAVAKTRGNCFIFLFHELRMRPS